jgi:hypothetical protein
VKAVAVKLAVTPPSYQYRHDLVINDVVVAGIDAAAIGAIPQGRENTFDSALRDSPRGERSRGLGRRDRANRSSARSTGSFAGDTVHTALGGLFRTPTGTKLYSPPKDDT